MINRDSAKKSTNKNPRFSKYVIWRKVLLVVLGGILGFNVYRWNATSVAGNPLPMPFGWGTAVVMSGSMEPTLSANDLVFVHEEDDYEVDDIVVYQSGSMLVIHRIIDIQGDTVLLQGDANNAVDDPISISDIKGKLAYAIPLIGGFFLFLKNTPIALILFILAFFLIENLWKKQKASDKNELQEIQDEIQMLRKELETKAQADNQKLIETSDDSNRKEESAS